MTRRRRSRRRFTSGGGFNHRASARPRGEGSNGNRNKTPPQYALSTDSPNDGVSALRGALDGQWRAPHQQRQADSNRMMGVRTARRENPQLALYSPRRGAEDPR